MKKSCSLLKIYFSLILIAGTLCAREYSPQEKLSQMFILGFKGTTYQDFKQFSNNNWGGYIFYSNTATTTTVTQESNFWFSKKETVQQTKKTINTKNIKDFEQTKELLLNIKKGKDHTKIKPFLAVDQEGGNYQIKLPNYQQFLAPLSVAQQNNEKIEAWAKEIAALLANLGFNLNLAPVVDINKAPFNNNRTYGNNPSAIVEKSKIFITAHHQQQIPCTLKHFPGRGNGTEQSLSNGYQEEIDLEPFKQLIKQKQTDLIMISYLKFPKLDPDNNAIFSKKINNILRKQLGFSGVVITDDLSNLNIQELSDEELTKQICKLIETGNDILLFANNNKYDGTLSTKLKTCINKIIDNKLISEKIIEKSFQRILDLKQKYNIEPKEIYLNYNI